MVRSNIGAGLDNETVLIVLLTATAATEWTCPAVERAETDAAEAGEAWTATTKM
jgi:hypothetical protein